MLLVIQGKWFAPGADLSDPVSVRSSVFGSAEDALDRESWNTVVYQDGIPAASGRIRWEEGAFLLDNIGVLPELRGKHLGDLTLRLLLFKAKSHGAREVLLTSPENISGFFSRLGFREESRAGNSVHMRLPGDLIDLDTCKSCRKQDCPNRKE